MTPRPSSAAWESPIFLVLIVVSMAEVIAGNVRTIALSTLVTTLIGAQRTATGRAPASGICSRDLGDQRRARRAGRHGSGSTSRRFGTTPAGMPHWRSFRSAVEQLVRGPRGRRRRPSTCVTPQASGIRDRSPSIVFSASQQLPGPVSTVAHVPPPACCSCWWRRGASRRAGGQQLASIIAGPLHPRGERADVRNRLLAAAHDQCRPANRQRPSFRGARSIPTLIVGMYTTRSPRPLR